MMNVIDIREVSALQETIINISVTYSNKVFDKMATCNGIVGILNNGVFVMININLKAQLVLLNVYL